MFAPPRLLRRLHLHFWGHGRLPALGARFLRPLAIALVLGGWGLALGQSWDSLAAYRWQPHYALLPAALAAPALAWVCLATGWQRTLRASGGGLSLAGGARVWVLSNFMRYVPGNVWNVVGRVYLAGQMGEGKLLVLASSALEQTLTVLAAMAVFLLSLPFWPQRPDPFLPLLGLLPLGLAAIHPALWRRLLPVIVGRSRPNPPAPFPAQEGGEAGAPPGSFPAQGSGAEGFHMLVRATGGAQPSPRPAHGERARVRGSLLPGSPLQVPSYAALLRLSGWYALYHVLAGGGLLAAAAALGPVDWRWLPLFAGASAIAWTAGYLSFLTPSGLGVREAALTWLLTPVLGFPVAVGASLLARLAGLLAEALLAGGMTITGWGSEDRSTLSVQR